VTTTDQPDLGPDRWPGDPLDGPGPEPAETADGPGDRRRSGWDHVREVLVAAGRRTAGASWDTVATGLVVACCAAFVFITVDPRLILSENTPTGGDMGSHVWGPMALMRDILPHGRLTGWSPDWYAGFPAFQFYMVVPMLAVVILHVGVRSPLLVLSLPAVLALLPLGWFVPRLARYRWALFGVGAFLALLVLPVPYGVSFKLVVVSGMVALPVAAWALGRLAGAPFPVPPALALGSLFFLYNIEPTRNSGTGNIIGGNLTSTMAGEFSFSISLTLGLLYLGFLLRGVRTGEGRATAAVLLALCGLCHIIPAFYMLVATGLALVIWPGRARLRWFLPVGPVAGLLAAFWVLPFASRHAYVNDMGWEPLPHTTGDTSISVWEHIGSGSKALVLAVAVVAGVGAAVAAVHVLARRRWLVPGAVLGGLALALLARFALLHVSALEAGLIPQPPGTGGDEGPQDILTYLTPGALLWPLLLAVGGLVVGAVFQQRLAYLLAGLAVAGAAGFVWIPDGRLWNARVLPLYYLALFLLAALGVAEVIRAVAVLVSRDPYRPTAWIGVGAALPALAATLLFLGGPLDVLPGRTERTDGKTEWLGVVRDYRNPGAGWAKYNFRGLEGQRPVQGAAPGAAVPDGQGGWPEYRDLVATMQGLGEDPDHGCGRAFWEFGSDRLTTYGTTMSPMMLPYFTDGCIGSMEGLYFESSTTTPYHFLVQCQLSQQGSCSQRDLPYSGFDLERGLSQLEMLGVRYYMAFSPTAVSQAATSDRLTEVAVSGPWHVYELDREATALVVGLDHEPVVARGVEPTQDSWLDVASAWFSDPERWDVPFTVDGPDSWARVDVPAIPYDEEDGTHRRYGDRDLPAFPAREVRRAEVSDVRTGDESLSFRVDRPGTPVLVKVSYFPNWEVTGAEGPWRVSPNLMVVVPTSTEVSFHYARTTVDWSAYLLTALGVLAAMGLWRRGPVAVPEGLLARRRRERTEEVEQAAAEAWAAAWTPPEPPDDGPPVARWGPPETWDDPPPPFAEGGAPPAPDDDRGAGPR